MYGTWAGRDFLDLLELEIQVVCLILVFGTKLRSSGKQELLNSPASQPLSWGGLTHLCLVRMRWLLPLHLLKVLLIRLSEDLAHTAAF